MIVIVLVGAIAAMIALAYGSRWLVRKGIEALGASFTQEDMDEDQRHPLQDARNRLLLIFQVLILVSAIIWAMGRFPETPSDEFKVYLQDNARDKFQKNGRF